MNTYANITAIELVEFCTNYSLFESTATFLVNSQEIKFGKFEKYQLSDELARNLYKWEESGKYNYTDGDWDEENGGVKNEDGDFVSPYSDEEIYKWTIENFNDAETDTFEETFPEDFANMKNILCNIEPTCKLHVKNGGETISYSVQY